MFDGVLSVLCGTEPDGVATQELFARLAAAEPGPATIAVLAAFDPASLGETEQVLALQAWERQAAWLAARQSAALVAIGGAVPSEEDDVAREEIAAALRLSPAAADRRLTVARALATRLPATAAELEAGRISYLHALGLTEAVADLGDAAAAAVEDTVLSGAARQTVGQLRATARRAAAVADPVHAELAHAKAATGREVRVYDEPDGMATLWARLPAAGAATVFTALDTLARAAASSSPGDAVGIDARRADALVELASAALADPALPRAHRHRPQVRVTIDLPTLLGLADNPAELVGYGPIPPSVARALAADGTWRRLVTDPVDRQLLDYGRTSYAPPQPLVDYLLARDATCRFPGCPQPAHRCDIDHAVPFDSGGNTDPANCGVLCRRHHRLKTDTRWRLKRHPDGAVTWTSPTGARYDLPPPVT